MIYPLSANSFVYRDKHVCFTPFPSVKTKCNAGVLLVAFIANTMDPYQTAPKYSYCLLPWQSSMERLRFFFFTAVILLPAHPASFAHKFCLGMQSFYLDAIVLQTCH